MGQERPRVSKKTPISAETGRREGWALAEDTQCLPERTQGQCPEGAGQTQNLGTLGVTGRETGSEFCPPRKGRPRRLLRVTQGSYGSPHRRSGLGASKSKPKRVSLFPSNLERPARGSCGKSVWGSHVQSHKVQGLVSYLTFSDSLRTATLDPRIDVTWKSWS